MPRRLSIALLALTLLACARPAPEPLSDAGAVHVDVAETPRVATTPEPWRDAGARPDPWADKRAAWLRGRARLADAGVTKMRAPLPPDSRVVACTRNATDKATLMQCLDALRTVQPFAGDAGAHLLGATRPPVINPACAVPDWYLSTSGNDANTCTTSGAPCKTRGEVNARTGGIECPLSTVTTYHVLTDLPITDPMDWRPVVEHSGLDANIVGSVVSIGSGSLASVTAKSISGGQALQADLGASAATFVGLRICNTTHTSCAWVDEIVTGHVARISQPVASDEVTEVDTWANGDAFTVTRPVEIYAQEVNDTTLSSVWLMPMQVISRMYDSLIVASVIDANVTLDMSLGVIVDTFSPGDQSLILRDTEFLSGVAHSPFFVASTENGFVGSDAILYRHTIFAGTGATDYENVYLDSSSNLEVAGGSLLGYHAGAFYGSGYLVSVNDGRLVYYGTGYPTTASAADSFFGAGGLLIFGVQFAIACDRTVVPMQCRPHTPLDAAHLDVSYASGGFDGIALANHTMSGFVASDKAGSTVAPSPLCSSGQFMTGQSPACATPAGTGCATCTTVSAGTGISVSGGPAYTVANTGVTSAVAGTGMAVSASTGAVTFTNSGATSVTGSSGISCSPTTGAVACTNTAPAPTLTAHDIVIGNGTTTPVFLAPGTSGNVATSNGTDWGSSPAVNSIAATGPVLASASTGAVTVSLNTSGVTTGGLVQWNGTSALSTIGPGTFGSVPFSTGSVFTTVQSTNFLPATAFSARAATTAGVSIVSINTATITVPTGLKLNVVIWFDFGPNADCSSCTDDINYGVGYNSSLFTVSETTTLGANPGGSPATGRGSATLVDQTSTSGSVTVHALAQVNASGTVPEPIGAAILLSLSN